ncbi:MAG TPA: GNAT family N-acetyltransferase [Chitinophagaceae bacterium]|nr:GNAT family N-acetyltransferase [Chitinophagaceae bacterium]
MYPFYKPTESDFYKLLTIWEASVRATHDFLNPDDILFFKHIIQQHNAFSLVELTCIVNEHNKILGFMGIAEDKLEMLFLDPAERGKGLGKQLMLYAFETHHITKVDVNEQNEAARQFYEHFGFIVISRSPLDGTGKPYPILHMELK